jgi:SOS response regulatory protein OraA/RecX
LLARRAHTEWELCERLRRRGLTAAEAAGAVRELNARGLIDDGATAARWAHSWRDRKGWGPLRIAAELGRRGIGRPLTQSLLGELFPDDRLALLADAAALRLVARPAFRRASASGGQGPVRWLAAQLRRRGFPSSAIRRAVRNRCPSAQEDDKIGPDVTD